MSILEEARRRADELWAYWQGLGPRVNSVPDVERSARRELMARYISQGTPEVLVPLVLAADHNDRFDDVDTLACALAEKGNFKAACGLWDRILSQYERAYRKGQRLYRAHLRRTGLGEGSADATLARVNLLEAVRVDLAAAYDKYLNLFAAREDDGDGQTRQRLLERRTRIFTAAPPEEPVRADARAMTEDVFWELIEQSRAAGLASDDRVAALAARLKGFRPREILRFGKTVADLVRQAYTWDLWGAAYLLSGGCSDDGFPAFCGWLILQGRERYRGAVEDPEAIANWWAAKEADPPEAEGLLYAAAEAYEEVAGKEAPEAAAAPGKPRGKRWTEDELAKRLPKLWQRRER